MSEFGRLVDEFFAYWWREHPEHATAVGVHTHDGELAHYDEASRVERLRHFREYLDAFDRVDPAGRSEALDRILITGRLRWEVRELERVRTYARNPAVYLEAPLSALYLMAVRDYAPPEERARRATERLAELPGILDEARENLTDAAAALVRPAAQVARSGLALLQGALPLSLGKALEDDPDEFARWHNALRGAEAALTDYARWLEEELAPQAAGDFALGREAFEARLRDVHGLAYTAEALRDYGAALKADTERALTEQARELEGHDDWRRVIAGLKADHPAADELIGAYADAMERARAFVEERGLVHVPPGETLEVVPSPHFLRPLIPYAAYQPPAPFEADQTGLFFVTPPAPEVAAEALRDHATASIPVTAVHEAYPGHHLQFVRANTTDSVARRVFWTSVFAEGWALYCEELMWEQGFYTDPRQRMLQLKDLLWRACRVVVDVGLHVQGWSVAQAVDYMVEEAGLERANAEVEVHRYCAEPTQPLSYAVGKREIMGLLERYRARQGDAFDLREFHDRLLSWGTIPPSLVAWGMDLAGPPRR